ncbi:PLC-like phosphodiesterase [Melampsora americana]|nr:PLC-like phosphodiesterase [Melampsora americana]
MIEDTSNRASSKPELENLTIGTSIVLDISSPTPIQPNHASLFEDREICVDPEGITNDPITKIELDSLSRALPRTREESSPSRLRKIASSIFLRPSHARTQSETRFDSEESSGGDGTSTIVDEENGFDGDTTADGREANDDHSQHSRKSSASSLYPVSPANSPRLDRPKSIASLASASLMMGALQPAIPPVKIAASLQIKNETGWTIRTVQWPTKTKRRGRTSYLLSHFRGNYFDESSIPPVSVKLQGSLIDIGIIPQLKRLKSRKAPSGWIYLDLIKPDGYVLHLQCFIKLDRSGRVITALIGRFDLDSKSDKPMPSGLLGTAEVSGVNPAFVTYHLTTAELINAENTVDDTPLKPLIMVPTKGITLSSYVSHPFVTVSFRAGKDGRYHEGQRSTLGTPDNCGQFTRSEHSLGGIEGLPSSVCVQHRQHPQPILNRSVTINPLSGLVSEGDKRLPLASTSESKSIFLPELNLSLAYGFHDSRMGKRHSMYTYVTPHYSSWLGDLIVSDARWLKIPFSRLVLQGSHDSGMFTPLNPGFVQMITKMKLDSDIGSFMVDHGMTFVHVLTRLLKTFNIDLENAICNVANTQKDHFYDQLRSGARFFDFRPGYCFHECVNGEKGKIHHQHACVPGYEYQSALTETFKFLALHPKEIVVYELKSDGFISQKTTWRKDSIPVPSMIPTRQALSLAVEEARAEATLLEPSVKQINVGGPSDLDRPIGTLLTEGIRLIIIHRMGEEPEQGWDWIRDDSYDHVSYDTDRPEPILDALSKTYVRNSVSQSSDRLDQNKPLPGTIYQLQATPTKSISDDIATSLTYSKASSLLVYTKATVDPHTYRWIRERHFVEPGLVVLLNDFVDPVLTEHAIEKSKIRAGLYT